MAGATAQQEPNWVAVLALPGTHLHLYGKTEARKARKMGHLTVTASTAEQARAVALQAAAILGMSLSDSKPTHACSEPSNPSRCH